MCVRLSNQEAKEAVETMRQGSKTILELIASLNEVKGHLKAAQEALDKWQKAMEYQASVDAVKRMANSQPWVTPL